MGLKEFKSTYERAEPDLLELRERLREELELIAGNARLGGEKPIVEVRVKSCDSVLGKLSDDAMGKTPEDVLGAIDDLVGARFVVLGERQALQIQEAVTRLGLIDGATLRIEPKPGQGGYQATHIKVTSAEPVQGFRVGIEIQVRRAFEDAWARLSHAYTYKKEGAVRDLPEYLNALATVIDGVSQAAELAGAKLDGDRAAAADLALLAFPTYLKGDEDFDQVDLRSNGTSATFGQAQWRSTADLTGGVSGTPPFKAFPVERPVKFSSVPPFQVADENGFPQYLCLEPSDANEEARIELAGDWPAVRSVYLLAMAGNGWERDFHEPDFFFKDEQIGSLDLRDDSGEWVSYPLILNHNIREWTAPRSFWRVCEELSPVAKTLEVWRDPDRSAIVDCLRFRTYPVARQLRTIRIRAHFHGDLKKAARPGLPTVNVLALTLGRTRVPVN